jgi:hypothetical protein
VSGLLRSAVFIVKRDENSNYCDTLNRKRRRRIEKEEGRKERFPPGTDLNWHLPCIIKLLYSPHRTNCKYRRYVAINKMNYLIKYHITYNFHR